MTDHGAEQEFLSRYEVHDAIGKGAYAVVYKCTQRSSGNTYAVKVVDKSKAGPKDIDDLAHEISIMEKIGYHPHVVQLIEYFVTPRNLYIVMDLLSGGMLFDRIVKLKHYSESNAADLVRNLLSALQHMHSKNIIHRDLKPENLLLRYAESSAPSSNAHLTDVCLADFGLAGYSPTTTCCGSPSYIAPEVIKVGYLRTQTVPYDCKCDVWSLGVITYILLSGRMPFRGTNFKETFLAIVNNRWSFGGDIWAKLTPQSLEFVRACLTQDPQARPSAAELLKHPWIAERVPDVHLGESLEGLRKFNAQQKIRAAVRVFCWTQSLLGGSMDRTPPFMRYLRHSNKYSTVVEHQSQTDVSKVHFVDFGIALKHGEPGWRLQDCCTCASEQVCRHIQNVNEYLFVGKRSMEVYPFIEELKMMEEEEEDELASKPDDKDAADKLRRVKRSIEAAYVFTEELAKVPSELLKPNFMLESTRSNPFMRTNARGGAAASSGSNNNNNRASNNNTGQGEAAAANKLMSAFRAKKAAGDGAEPPKPNPAAKPVTPPAETSSSSNQVPASPRTKSRNKVFLDCCGKR